MAEIININEIMTYIPHRYPFLLIDKVIDFKQNESATGIKCVTMNENFFQGHFPNEPVMPGVLQIEALAQTAAVLVIKSLGKKAPKNCGILFTGIEKVKFRKPVVPGDQLNLSVKILKEKLSIYVIEGIGYVDGKKVIESEFSAMLYDRDVKKVNK
ncbi:MAG: 3-hydroxyacyl-ACP dehydratase FabZ [Rickettsiales bacterium]|jgi:3-hydroxyacyl-[acyl-carrier-protein] dehydratase|nr:3-hydroxyacyl-ACP dehydratase FabZ [Rickettsiales bacterium]